MKHGYRGYFGRQSTYYSEDDPVPPEFDPKIAEFTARGATAVLILDAQKRLCGICVEQILSKIDSAVTNDRLTPERAVGFCHELAAFRRIVQRQENEINQARLIAARGQNG